MIISLAVNFIFFYFDILPAIKKRIYRRRLSFISRFSKDQLTSEIEEKIINQSLRMAKSKTVLMPMAEQQTLIDELKKYFYRRVRKEKSRFNYPKAYLFAGLSEYGVSKQDDGLLKMISSEFDNYINNDGLPIFPFEKIDQIPFGIAAINLFSYFGMEKYKFTADYYFEKLMELKEEKLGIVYYRKNESIDFVDTIGMICPFLVRYGATFNNQSARELAKNQLKYYINKGLDLDSSLPAQALIKRNNIKVGSYNWGRGIGWFIIGLSDYLRFTNDSSYLESYNKIQKTLFDLRTKDMVWTQFPGSCEDFDASSTTMIMYGLNSILEIYTKNEIFSILKPHIIEGIIRNTSGDTYYANRFSHSFGESELSQGFLLMLLATAKK